MPLNLDGTKMAPAKRSPWVTVAIPRKALPIGGVLRIVLKRWGAVIYE